MLQKHSQNTEQQEEEKLVHNLSIDEKWLVSQKLKYRGQIKHCRRMEITVLAGCFPARESGVDRHRVGHRTLKTYWA